MVGWFWQWWLVVGVGGIVAIRVVDFLLFSFFGLVLIFFHCFCFLFFSSFSLVWLNFWQFILLISSCFAKQSFFFSNFFPHLFYLHIFMNVQDYVYVGGFFILSKCFFIIKKTTKNLFFFKNTFKYFDSRMVKFLKNKLYLYNLSILRKNHKNSFFYFLFCMHIGFHN